MAGKLVSLVPPLLLAAVGLAGLLLLCVPTQDVREPPALKVVASPATQMTLLGQARVWLNVLNRHFGMCPKTDMPALHSTWELQQACAYSSECLYPGACTALQQSRTLLPEQALRRASLAEGTWDELHQSPPPPFHSLTSPEATAKVLEAVTQTLTRYPFDFRGARILSGQDEGVFGWVTANYLLENFIKYGWVGRWIRPRKGTLGAMDLGGASTQITFETTSPSEDPDNEVHLRLYGQHYRVYTHSFLCYGRDQVLQRLLASALQIHRFHPCWPKGYSTQVLLREVYQSPCTMGQRPQTFNSSATVSLSGTSNAALCRDLVSGLFNISSCPFSQCSFNGVFQPPVAGNFIAFSAFYYTVDFLKTVMGLPVGTLKQLEDATETTCNQTWAELQARVPGQQTRLPDYCAVAMFIHQLLSRGYRFDERSFRGVVFEKKAADTAVGWALGYMLNLTNLIPADLPGLRKGTHFSSWVALLLLFTVLILAALVLLLRQVRSAKSPGAL